MAKTNVPLRSIVKHFETLPDPRHQRSRRHLLIDVITDSCVAPVSNR